MEIQSFKDVYRKVVQLGSPDAATRTPSLNNNIPGILAECQVHISVHGKTLSQIGKASILDPELEVTPLA